MSNLGQRKNLFSPAEDAVIRTYYGKMTAAMVADRLPGRSVDAVKRRARLLGLVEPRAPRQEGIAPDLRGAPVTSANARPRDLRPVIDRILAELAKAPRSTMTLASMLDVKESIIASELRILRYQGRVSEGEGVSERQRLWSLAMEMAA